MTVEQTFAKLEAHDPGSARTLYELSLYEALCDEADRIGDELERDVRSWVAKKAAQALPAVAKSHVAKAEAGLDTRATEATAELLGRLSLIGKADEAGSPDDPRTPYWDARDTRGRFRVADALRLLTSGRTQKETETDQNITSVLGTKGGYGRATLLGNALQVAGASGGPGALSTAGQAARLAGAIGPEAEKVLGPGIRRTAYRYRGTERRPSSSLQHDAALVTAAATGTVAGLSEEDQRKVVQWKMSAGGQQTREVSALMRNQEGKGPRAEAAGRLSPAAGALAGVKDGTQDQRRLQALSNFGVNALVPRLPNLERANISLQAGKLPPSVGLMFDAQGRLVSEAQGYNGDHYLPFDLKNLKRLKGGSYVRTRTSGGLTDEDIYTALMTGARRATVVSNSGVYSVEFDPDLRGGRRYSDKARQMVDRYSRLVAAIGSEELRQNDITPEAKRAIRDQAIADAGSAEAAEGLYAQRLKEARSKARFAARSDEELNRQAEANIAPQRLTHQAHAVAVEEEFQRLRTQDAAATVRTYKLDHQGYKAAQEALAQEFPFFIRSVEDTELDNYLQLHRQVEPGTPRRPRGGTDLGHTKPKALQPEKARNRGWAPAAAAAAAGATSAAASPSTAAGGGAAASASSGLDAEIAAALPAQRDGLREALHGSLRALDEKALTPTDADFWGLIDQDEDIQSATEAARRLPALDFGKWLLDHHGPSSDKVAAFLLTADDKVLEKTEAALSATKAKLGRRGVDGGFTPEGMDAGIAAVQRIRMLKSPWASGHDEDEKPYPFPDIVALGTDDAKRAAFEAANPEITKAAAHMLELGDDKTAEMVREAKSHLRKLQGWKQGEPPPAGLSEGERGEAEGLQAALAAGTEHGRVRATMAMEKAWSLARLHKLVGAMRGDGGAVPFAVEKRAGHSHAPSRVVQLSPEHPVSKALAARLARR
jgi:hypothetical protein